MSRSSEYSYILAMQMRQRLFDDRVRTTTETFYQRYKSQYEEMVIKGFLDYIPEEMSRLKSDLDHIGDLLISNPAEAREVSMEVGQYISSMFVIGRTAINEYESKERLRRQKLQKEMNENKSEAMSYFYSLIKNIKDPIVRDFAKDNLEKLKVSISETGSLNNASLQNIKEKLNKEISSIISSASKSASEWKEKKLQEKSEDIQLEMLNNMEVDLKAESIDDKNKVEEILSKISRMKQVVKDGTIDGKDFRSEIKNITEEIDDTVISESTRREAVKAIIKSLKAQEFMVEKPQLIETGSSNYVKIIAKKPSGKSAECRVDLGGKIKYKFDKYEGMSCLKDIEKFNVDLNEVYSIKLSDERVLWENPIRISKDSKPIEGNLSRGNK